MEIVSGKKSGGGGYCYKKYVAEYRLCCTVCMGLHLPFEAFWVGGG